MKECPIFPGIYVGTHGLVYDTQKRPLHSRIVPLAYKSSTRSHLRSTESFTSSPIELCSSVNADGPCPPQLTEIARRKTPVHYIPLSRIHAYHNILNVSRAYLGPINLSSFALRASRAHLIAATYLQWGLDDDFICHNPENPSIDNIEIVPAPWKTEQRRIKKELQNYYHNHQSFKEFKRLYETSTCPRLSKQTEGISTNRFDLAENLRKLSQKELEAYARGQGTLQTVKANQVDTADTINESPILREIPSHPGYFLSPEGFLVRQDGYVFQYPTEPYKRHSNDSLLIESRYHAKTPGLQYKMTDPTTRKQRSYNIRDLVAETYLIPKPENAELIPVNYDASNVTAWNLLYVNRYTRFAYDRPKKVGPDSKYSRFLIPVTSKTRGPIRQALSPMDYVIRASHDNDLLDDQDTIDITGQRAWE